MANGRKSSRDAAVHQAALRRIVVMGRSKLREQGTTDVEIDAAIREAVRKLTPQDPAPTIRMAPGILARYRFAMAEADHSDVMQTDMAWCIEKRAHTEAKLQRVKDGLTFHEGHNGVALIDVTDKRVARWNATIERLDAIIAAYEREAP